MTGRIAGSLLLLSACAHRPQAGAARRHAPIPLPHITSADDIDLALDEHAAIPIDHPQRAASRAALRGWLLADLAANLRHDHPDTAFERFLAALRLYSAEELAYPQPDAPLLAAAEEIRAAFSPRGGEREVLTALATQLSFRPRDRTARQRYETLCAWIDEVSKMGDGPAARGPHLVQIHEVIIRDLPSAFVRDRLEERYLGLHSEFGRVLRHGLPPQLLSMLGTERALAQFGYRLAGLQLRAGTLQAALAAVRRLRGQPGDDPDLRRLLQAAAAPEASPADFVSLARYFAPQDPDVAERACLAGVIALGEHPDLLACAADLAAKRGMISLALARARMAVLARPDSPAVREQVARLLRARVEWLVGRERMDAASREVETAVRFLAETHRRLPNLDLDPTPGAFQSQLALGFYNTGYVARAEELFERSLQGNPPPTAYEELGVIRWRRGRFDEALALFDQAARQPLGDVETQLKLAARLRGRMGDTMRDKGDPAGARDAWRDSLRLWGRYVAEGATELDDGRPEAVAMAQVERARLLYDLDDTEEARRAIAKAIDAAPERGETYVQAVALLATHGHVPEATDALHRALGQPAVNDYYKIYCSLWIFDLGRRSVGRPDPLAQRYLESVDGDQWHHRLARFMTGRISYAAMEPQADTPGRKAELFFYEAQNRLAAGRIDEARGLWERVLRTDMMAFFEYDMALHYLAAHAR